MAGRRSACPTRAAPTPIVFSSGNAGNPVPAVWSSENWRARSDAPYLTRLNRLMIAGFSDTVCDAWLEERLVCNLSSAFIGVCLRGRAFGATNTGGRIKFERIADADSARVFATDPLGIEAIAESSS